MSNNLNLTLIIIGLSVDDAKKIAQVILEMAEEDPTRHFQLVLKGLEGTSREEAQKILHEILPRGGVAS